jgi:hypothetical protein
MIFVMEKCCFFFAIRTEVFNIIMRSLHDVYEMNAYRADHVCLSAWLNLRTDSDKISYGRYDIGVRPRIILFSSLQSVIPTWQTNKFVRWIDTSATCIRAIQ